MINIQVNHKICIPHCDRRCIFHQLDALDILRTLRQEPAASMVNKVDIQDTQYRMPDVLGISSHAITFLLVN